MVAATAKVLPRSPARNYHSSTKHHEPPPSPSYVPSSNGETIGAVLDNRKQHSRNSTSSWDCSDSDSMHSSEIGQNGSSCLTEAASRTIVNRPPVKCNANEKSRGSHGNERCKSPLPSRTAAKTIPRKECWADTLRAGCVVNDRIRRMEEGWNDCNVIRSSPRERKWHRITAEIEQRNDRPRPNNAMYGSRSSGWGTGNSKKTVKRGRPGHQRSARPIQDIIEWEELFELALARKIRRKIRGKGKVDGTNVAKSGARSSGQSHAKDEKGCMKRLEVLLQSRVTPQIDEVRVP